MSRRVLLAALVVMATAAPLMAAPGPGRHQISFTFGSFNVRGEEARVEGDVLVANLGFLNFSMEDFNGFVGGVEYLFSPIDWLEVGAGISRHSSQKAKSFYTDLTYADGSDIMQDLKLRIVPITGTVRFLPLGLSAETRDFPLQVYLGGGIAALFWQYSEVGDFVDYEPDPPEIFREQYVQKGRNAGMVLLGGARVRAGSRIAIGGEVRYLKGQGELGSNFYGDKIDLGGFSYNFTFNVRF